MRVDGRDITVSGSLLQPLTRRTTDILRLTAATVLLAVVITGSLITRNDWVALEKSISGIVGVLTPTQSNLVYLAYGIAILALPFAILIGLLAARQWKLLGAYAAAGGLSVLHCRSPTRHRRTALALRFGRPARHGAVPVPRRSPVDRHAGRGPDGVGTVASRALAAVVVDPAPGVRADPSGGQRRGTRPCVVRAGGGLARRRTGGVDRRHPGLEVPLEGAVRALARRGFPVSALTVVRPAGRGPLILEPDRSRSTAPRQRPPWSRCTAPINAVVAHCASSGESCGCAPARPLRCSCRCAARSSIAA